MNLWWGLVMLVFGLAMLLRIGGQAEKSELKSTGESPFGTSHAT